MESNAFGSSHLQSQALVVLSEAASGLHEALRGQRPFPTRLPDAKDLHNMSLVGSYGTHLLHSFHPHLLQTLNHGMLAANGGPAANYFASDRTGLGKPSVLSNFQLPSAFSPPKYIGISLDQNIFNGSESFRTDSASPTCTSHESMEGSNDYDAEKGESPRSNNSDPRDLRHVHNKASTSVVASTASAVSAAAVAAAAAAAVASVASTTTSPPVTVSHLTHHMPPSHAHHHHHHHHHPNGGNLLAASMGGLGLATSAACQGLRAMPSGIVGGLSAVGAAGPTLLSVGVGVGGLSGHVPDICPVCGIKLSAEEWNSHFLTELDRLYKLSAGMERANLQATYMFAPPCPAQENAIRTSHNRWETFQRIRNNRQNRLRIKVRKRKYGNELYFMENLLCSSCPICKRKYAIETGKLPPEDDPNRHEEIETVDVESCNDDVPDSGSEMQAHTPLLTGLSGSGGSGGSSNGSSNASNLSGGNMHSNNNQPGKLDGILYRTACVINKDSGAGLGIGGGEDDISTNVPATSTSSNGSSNGSMVGNTSWGDTHTTTSTSTITPGHISVKNVSELSSTTHHFYNADSCGDERGGGGGIGGGIVNCNGKDIMLETCNNDSDEDVIVDDDDSIKMTNLCKKRKYEETIVVSSRNSDNHSPYDERPRSEPQVTSTEPNIEITNNNNKYTGFEDLRAKHHQSQQPEPDTAHNGGGVVSGLTQLDTKVGNSSDNKPDDENKCFICKTGIKDLSADSFFRGRNLYFHQSCANVMSSYRLNKDLQQQQLLQQQQEADKSPRESSSVSNN